MKTGGIHGDIDQYSRMEALKKFKAGTTHVLVATDVAARGLDVRSVKAVVNYDVAASVDTHVHRIGRTGRAGRSGVAIMICNPRDEKNLADVERLVTHEIPRLEDPVANSGGAPAEEAKPAREEKPRRTRSRKPREAEKEDAKPETANAQKPEPVEETAPTQEKPQREQHGRGGRNRGGKGDGGGRHEKIVGMGDDTPAFIALSFDERAKA